jgi:2-haloacid dehalogenase
MLADRGIQACVFDAYGTLLDLGSAVAAETGRLGGQAEALSALWRRKQLEYTWLRSLMRRHADFAAVTADALDFSLEALGLGDRGDGLRDRLLGAYRRLSPYPEVPEVLAALKRQGVRTAILSNGSPDMLREGIEAAGLADRLGEVLSVEEVGVFKPAPEVYHLATSRLGLPARAVAFLSSNGWDVHGAASFGFATVWVNRGSAPDERLPGAPVAAIPSLEPLPRLLGREG